MPVTGKHGPDTHKQKQIQFIQCFYVPVIYHIQVIVD